MRCDTGWRSTISPRTMRLIGKILAAAGGLALLAAFAEGAACATLRWRKARHARTLPAAARSSVYRNQAWARDYWREWSVAARVPDRLRYDGAGILRLRPFAGTTINISDAGLRRTVSDCSNPANATIAMYGSSMLWGHGSPDAETIPSVIATDLRGRGQPVCVENHGQWAMTAARAAIDLQHDLERGQRPDVVVFYIGSQDVKETLFARVQPLGNEMDVWIDEMQQRRPCSCLRGLGARLLRSEKPPLRMSPAEIEAVSADVVRRLATIHAVVEALGRRFGFETHFVLHPDPITRQKPLSVEERAVLEWVDQTVPAISAAIRRTYPALAAQEWMTDLSGAFAGHTETIYIDAGHVGPAGNRIVAGRLSELLSTTMTGKRR